MADQLSPLEQAFEDWLSHQRVAGRLRRGSSEAVYRAMWHALAAWCRAQRPALRLTDLQGRRLLHYLASRRGQQLADGVLTPRYQQRLVSLVQRVQAHQAWRRLQAHASAPQALALATTAPQAIRATPLLAGSAGSPAEPPLHLQPAQAQSLIDWLSAAAPDAAAGPSRWQTWRDRCAAALQLGAGLGPGDVRALTLDDLQPAALPARHGGRSAPPRWCLHVPANGSASAHTAPLADWAGAVLARWLERRAAEALGGPWLLPSTRSGKPWGKVAQYESARRVLADAGLDADGGGSFRLRHSFALRQLQQGHDADTVAGWLGVTDPQVMLRYQQVLSAWPATGAAALSGPGPWPV